MSELNVANRTLAIMDNLHFLRSINNECIDLIAIDPPFATNETFSQPPKPPITEAELAEEKALARKHGVEHNEGIGETRVKDVWSWDEDVHPAWKMRIADDHEEVHAVIQAVEACATENEAAYIAFMAARLIECERVLKSTGSIYVHCDDHANSYLRMLMDAVFGSRNFRNELVWERAAGRSDAKSFARVHDTILYYVKTENAEWYQQYEPLSEEYVSKNYRYEDEHGRFTTMPLMGGGVSGKTHSFTWKGVHADNWRFTATSLDRLEEQGLIYWSKNGRPRRRFYLSESLGVAARDVITNINRPPSRERTGYSTQKPLALYERIIQASSNPGDVVLDIFAGCATTAIAAERLGRQWIACDMAYRSWTMLKRRFLQNGWKLAGTTTSSYDAMAKVKAALPNARPKSIRTKTIGPNELPKRGDTDPVPYHHLAGGRRGRRTTQTASWSGRISKEDAKKLLIERFGPVCWGCGYEPRRPNGTLDDTLLEVDHIRARKASEGVQGNDELYNLAVLHRTCNGIKRNKLTLEELRQHNALEGLLYVNSIRALVDLYEATQFAQEQIAQHIAIHGYQPALVQE